MTRPKPSRFDGELLWTFSLSLAAHAALTILFLSGPNRYLAAVPPPLESYTVELIAPGAIGGDDGPLGVEDGGDVGPAPLAEPAADSDDIEPAAEPVVAAEEPEAVVEPEPAVEEAEPEALAAPVVEAEEIEPVAEPEVEDPLPEPVVEVEEPEPEPEPEVVVEEEESEPEPVVEVEEPEPDQDRAEEKDDAVARPVEVAKSESPSEPKPVVDKPASTPAPKARSNPAEDRDRRIAEAIGRRVETARPLSAEDRIAAAVRRRAEQVSSSQVGAGGAGGSGGPLSAGPGSGGGGTVIGAEYLLYKRRMEARIRDSWVWAGADDGLESVIHFAISSEGEVENVRTTRSSGDRAYDASAERAVRAASPLGMVPPNYRREFADVEMTFRAQDLRR